MVRRKVHSVQGVPVGIVGDVWFCSSGFKDYNVKSNEIKKKSISFRSDDEVWRGDVG